MAYSANIVANYFIKKAHGESEDISPMRLIKLVYYAHGWCLGLLKKPLIDEQIEAWQYGPVVANLYQNFKKFGNQNIIEEAPVVSFQIHDFENDNQTLDLLDNVWMAYKKFTPIQLSNMTHELGSPWDVTWNKNNQGGMRRSLPIDNDLIKDSFIKEVQKTQSS